MLTAPSPTSLNAASRPILSSLRVNAPARPRTSHPWRTTRRGPDPQVGRSVITAQGDSALRLPELAEGSKATERAAAHAELQNLLLDGPDVGRFLQQVTQLATAVIVPPAACGITLRRDEEVSTVAHSGELAIHADEIQYGRGQGPCLEALRTATIVQVSDLTVDKRWPAYRIHALAQGVRSSLSLPLMVNGHSVGALNLYTATPHDFDEVEVAHASAFAAQTAIALTIVLRHADQVAIEDQLCETLATRAVIDQALGIVMGQRGCTASEAFAVLREASQRGNRKLSEIAAELIETITGQPPQPPRPFIRRR